MRLDLPVHSPESSQLYEIPGYSRYAVTLDGQVWNREMKIFLEGSRNPDGYVNFRLTGDDGVVLTWGRHRLLGYVFMHPGIPIDNLVVNHKNGIKGYDKLYNLEWTTYQGNAEHAGATGLTEKCSPISVRDIDTGEIQKFPSIVECARCYGLTKDAVNYRVKIGERRIFPERKQYRLTHSDSPWYIPEDIDRELLSNGTSKRVLIRDVLKNEVKEYDKLSDLSVAINVPLSTLTLWLSAVNQPVLPGFIQLKMGIDPHPWRQVHDPYLELGQYIGKKPVQVIHDETEETKVYSFATECAKEMKLSTTALNYRLKSNGQTVFSDGYRYGYYPIQMQHGPISQ